MRLLFLGLNYAPEEVGIGLYSGEMLRAWVDAGHDAEAVVAHPYYPFWKVFEGYGGVWRSTEEAGVAITRCPIYVPARPTGLRRILHHLSFAASCLIPMLRCARRRRPDVVMTTAPSLLAAPVALLTARLFRARAWLHVQDFELEAALATGLMQGGGVTVRLIAWFERLMLTAFDVVSTISPQMCARLRLKGVDPAKVFEFRNWADLDEIKPQTAPSPYRAEWMIETPHVALYSGNIALKQGIELVLDAAQLLQHRKDLIFVICGDGPTRLQLESGAASLPNVRIQNLQPKARLGELLCLASVHLLPQIASAADLVLPSKLANMLASGRPVVATAEPGTGLADEMEGVGIVTSPGDATAFAQSIEYLIDAPETAKKLGEAARLRAEERWSRKFILRRFVAKVSNLVAQD